MGATFFLLFLAVIFFVALFFIVLSIVFIISWIIRKQKKKPLKKRWLIVPAILLAVNVLVILIPVGFLGFLRYTNNTNAPDVVYAESGTVLYWPIEGDETTNFFEMGGVKYSRLQNGPSDNPFFFNYTFEQLGEPVANIKHAPSNEDPIDEFLSVLFSGRTRSERNISTVYPIENENGFELYYVTSDSRNPLTRRTTFCAESEIDSIMAYYTDISHYDTQNLVYKYTLFADGGDPSEGQEDIPRNNIEEAVVLRAGVFETVSRLYQGGRAPEHIEIPEKYNAIREAAIPGTPIFGYEERVLMAYSEDTMTYKHVPLALIDGQVYAVKEVGGGYMTGYPIPADINQYIIESLFVSQ